MLRRQSRIGINLTESKFQFVEILFEGTEVRLLNAGEHLFPQSINWFSDNESKIEETLGSGLREKVFTGNSNSTIVSFSFPLEVFKIFRSHRIDKLDKNEISQYYNWELSVLFPHLDFSGYTLSAVPIKNNLLFGKEGVIVAAVKKKIIKDVSDLCKGAKIRIGAFDTAHFAFDKTMQFLHKEFSVGISATVFPGENYFSFELFSEGNVVFYKMLPAKYDYYELLLDLEKIDPALKDFSKNINRIYICGGRKFDSGKIYSEINGAEVVRSELFSRLTMSDKLKKDLGSFNQDDFMSAAGMALRVY